MAFVVEDGTGVAGATSYVTVAYADDYFADRDNVVWDAITDDGDKEGYLIRATDYVEKIFGRRFIGEMADMTYPLSWPRLYADPYEETDIPDRLKKAVCEYALRAIDGPLMPDPTVDATGFHVVTTRKAVGPIEKEFRVAGNASRPNLVRSYPEADGWIAPLLAPGSLRVTR